MFRLIKNIREKKKREQEERERMHLERRCAAKSMGLSIWGIEMGDGAYVFVKKEMDDDKKILTIYFEEDIRCIIYKPRGVHWDGCLPTIQDADKIVWEGHYYGTSEENERRYVEEYTKIDSEHIRVVQTQPNYEIIEEKREMCFVRDAISTIPQGI